MWISGLGVEGKEAWEWRSCVSNSELMTAILSIHCLKLHILIIEQFSKEYSILFTDIYSLDASWSNFM